MGNLGFVSSRRNLVPARVGDDLDEINERRFGGFFNVFQPSDSEWDIGYPDDEGQHQHLWYFHVQSPRRIGGKHSHLGLTWVEWARSVFQAELGVKWNGRISDEGVEGTWCPKEDLEKTRTLDAYLAMRYSHIPEDDPRLETLMQMEVKSIEDTMPKALMPHALPNEIDQMKRYVQDTFASLGATVEFEPDDDLSKFRRGRQLTMGDLRAKKDGDVVWLYIWHKESVRADGTYRLEKSDGCWLLDDGSSFAADFVDEEGPDTGLAEDEYSKIYEAVPL